ncbi:MAG: methyltransferase domain-containing protein [Deltaproteobacteria bacterium]|nr:MAG: methyltransferase domain-containing protein [Deltaproteobacteria bacterium]
MSEADPSGIFAHLTVLSEPLRARILRVLEREELGVGELSRVLQLPQSTVSRHLKVLLVHGWIHRRTEGPSARVSLATDTLGAEAASLWPLVRDEPGSALTAAADLARLESVLAQRQLDSRAFFGRVAARWDALRDDLYGQSFTLPTLLSLLPPGWVVADLGCGTGETVARLAPVVRRVIGIDQEAAMLDAARARVATRDNVELLEGDLAALPLPAESVDAALLLLVLHHIADPIAALAEARRILRPGGVVVALDMVAHDRAEYRQTMGHQHLGFGADAFRALAESAGLELVDLERLTPDPVAQGPGLFVARLQRPAALARS